MERHTPCVTGPRWPGWAGHAVVVGFLALGPETVGRVIAGLTSVVSWPLTREVAFDANRFEIRNAQLLIVYLIAVVGLNLLFQVGVVSLGQSAPFLVGAYVSGLLATETGWSFWAAVPAGALAAGAIGTLLGLPALRLGPFSFVMVTLGYAIVAGDMVLQWRSVTGGGDGMRGIAQPRPFDTLEDYYWVVAAAGVIAYAFAHNYLRSPYGRAGKAVEADPVAAQSLGISGPATKVRAFAIASTLAGVAGGLYGSLFGFIAPEAFGVHLAILFVLMTLLGGRGTLLGPVIGTLVLFRIPLAVEDVTDQAGDLSLLIYGVVLLLSVHFVPHGLAGLATQVRAWRRRQWGGPADPPAGPPDGPPDGPERDGSAARLQIPDRPERGVVLEVTGVAKQLGGVRAVDGVDLRVDAGTVHALIGPNGSGKTTFLNLVSGYVTPDAGTVALFGSDVTRLSAEARARRGLGRTFQTPSVFAGMSARENVMCALDGDRRGHLAAYSLRLPAARREERESWDRAATVLDSLGLGPWVDADADSLPPGRRRLLELARVVSLGPGLVLLDEPAAGLTSGEIDQLEDIVRGLRDAGIGVLLVEHHVDFVLRIADVVTVVDFGQVIARGSPDRIRDDERVVASYFGDAVSEAVTP